MIRVVLIGFFGCIVCSLIKQVMPAYFILSELAVAALLLLSVYPLLLDFLDFFSEYNTSVGISSEFVSVTLKAFGIALLTEFSANICRDNGDNTLASSIELCGKIMMFVCSLPILRSVVELALKMIGES